LYSWPHDLVPAPGGGPSAIAPRPVNTATRGRARPTLGGPRAPVPPLEFGRLRQPGEGMSPVVSAAVPAPQVASPRSISTVRDETTMAPSHTVVPQPETGPLPVLVDPSYGRTSSDTTTSMALVAGALEGVHLGDAPPLASGATTQMFNEPPLLPSNLIAIARMAFTHGQAQRFAVSTVEIFDTDLTAADIMERLTLLMLMRHDVASQVREIILLGQVREEPPAVILNELLDLTELYMRDPDRAIPF